MTFASGLKAIYVTLQPKMRRDLRATTQPGAPPNAILALRWRFESVKHLYSKYIPPPEIIPSDLSPDISAAYQQALDAEHLLSQSESLAPSVNGSAQQHELTLAAGPPVGQTADANNDTPEEGLRRQVAQLRAKLEFTRREIENKDQTLPQPLVDTIHEAEKELESQLRRYRKVSDSVADLKHDIRQQSSVLRAEKKRRRQLEQELADAQNAAAGKAIASTIEADQDSPESARLGKLRMSRDHLKQQISVREVELKERQEARQVLEDKFGSLKLAQAGLIVEGGESGMPPTAPALIRAFSDLHGANLQV
jgi:DNA repair exonuclease SbcCD ATPase subunit